MTPLGQELLALITKQGPLTLAEFMENALSHPEHGYYKTRFVHSAFYLCSFVVMSYAYS